MSRIDIRKRYFVHYEMDVTGEFLSQEEVQCWENSTSWLAHTAVASIGPKTLQEEPNMMRWFPQGKDVQELYLEKVEHHIEDGVSYIYRKEASEKEFQLVRHQPISLAQYLRMRQAEWRRKVPKSEVMPALRQRAWRLVEVHGDGTTSTNRRDFLVVTRVSCDFPLRLRYNVYFYRPMAIEITLKDGTSQLQQLDPQKNGDDWVGEADFEVPILSSSFPENPFRSRCRSDDIDAIWVHLDPMDESVGYGYMKRRVNIDESFPV